MFERFTDQSRKVMALANQSARHLGHSMIDTEHILLGILQEGTGAATNVLRPLVGGNLRKVRQEVEKLMPAKGKPLPMGKLPQTNEAKTAIMFAIEEAKSLHHGYVGTDHLLLGLLRENEGVAGRAISNLGLKIDVVRIISFPCGNSRKLTFDTCLPPARSLPPLASSLPSVIPLFSQCNECCLYCCRFV